MSECECDSSSRSDLRTCEWNDVDGNGETKIIDACEWSMRLEDILIVCLLGTSSIEDNVALGCDPLLLILVVLLLNHHFAYSSAGVDDSILGEQDNDEQDKSNNNNYSYCGIS